MKQLISVGLFLLAVNAQAYELLNPTLKTTWGPGLVPFYLHLGDYNKVADIKLGDWSQYMGATRLVGRDSSSLTPDWGNGRNDIAWSTDEQLVYNWPSNVLAITLPNYDWTTGRFIETDIVFNTRFVFSSYDDHGLGYDIGRILLHEIGHSIGLGHSNQPSVLQPYYGSIHELTADDIAGAHYLYGNQSAVPDWGSTGSLLLIGLSCLALRRLK
jgi:matrixin